MLLKMANYHNTPMNELGVKVIVLVKQGKVEKKDNRF